MPKKVNKRIKLQVVNDVTSSLNKHFVCNECGSKFKRKSAVHRHLHTKVCIIKDNSTCKLCNIKFKNRGSMIQHARRIHGDKSNEILDKSKYLCEVCDRFFKYNWQLKYHIRRVHFNLKAKQPYCELKKINQVWFEKVLNSNNIMEIKKTGENILVMRKLNENTAIKVNDVVTEVLDLSNIYPTGRPRREMEQCKYCPKICQKRNIQKHYDDVHFKNSRIECVYCNVKFKRPYIYFKHVCRRKGLLPKSERYNFKIEPIQ